MSEIQKDNTQSIKKHKQHTSKTSTTLILDVNPKAKHLRKMTNKIHQPTKYKHIDNTTIEMSEIKKDTTQLIPKNKPDTSSNKIQPAIISNKIQTLLNQNYDLNYDMIISDIDYKPQQQLFTTPKQSCDTQSKLMDTIDNVKTSNVIPINFDIISSNMNNSSNSRCNTAFDNSSIEFEWTIPNHIFEQIMTYEIAPNILNIIFSSIALCYTTTKPIMEWKDKDLQQIDSTTQYTLCNYNLFHESLQSCLNKFIRHTRHEKLYYYLISSL